MFMDSDNNQNYNLLKSDDNLYIANTYARNDLFLVKGKGSKVKDIIGNKYLDFTSGIGVNSLGFCDEKWVKAVSNQAAKMQHISNLYYTQPCIELAKTLCEKTGAKKVFFSNSGAESNEGAIKVARKYSYKKYGDNRFKIISLVNSFHGRTLATLAATGQDSFHVNYAPFPKGFIYAKANNYDEFLKCTSENKGVCAVMIEIVQGEGGVIPLNADYINKVSNWCNENDVLLIADEVQTGVGRTGTFLASEQFNLKPDIITLAKGLGGGLPIGAVLMCKKVENVFEPGDHGSTYGGNPIACAGANEVMNRITPEFLTEVKQKGEKLKKELLKLPNVESVDGLGLMLGISFKNNISSKKVVELCMLNGLLCLTAKSKMRLLPPLTVKEKEIESAVEIIKEVLNNDISKLI